MQGSMAWLQRGLQRWLQRQGLDWLQRGLQRWLQLQGADLRARLLMASATAAGGGSATGQLAEVTE